MGVVSIVLVILISSYLIVYFISLYFYYLIYAHVSISYINGAVSPPISSHLFTYQYIYLSVSSSISVSVSLAIHMSVSLSVCTQSVTLVGAHYLAACLNSVDAKIPLLFCDSRK